ncbi:MAG: nickel pincer cofactor biosynthesis protein LarB [Candidatus Brocadiales bacterium]|nr:nickel pincer cofactor biosynthesis protein LarB [Candidatus Bathyanammoxibius amoris]
MDINLIKKILTKVRKGEYSMEQALEHLKDLPYKDVGFAKVDSHRTLRRGFPEVIFSQGKTPEQVVKIAQEIARGEGDILATRANPEIYRAMLKNFPKAEYNETARTITIKKTRRKAPKGLILVVTAGTLDIPVAEEARVTAELMGNKVKTIYDAGVAGIHRLLGHRKELSQANVIIVVAGMEGALPGVVSGLVDCPVVGVPTSVGYGASFGGISPLLTMLNTCSEGVSVVNIDNGFGAGYTASLINKTRAKT